MSWLKLGSSLSWFQCNPPTPDCSCVFVLLSDVIAAHVKLHPVTVVALPSETVSSERKRRKLWALSPWGMMGLQRSSSHLQRRACGCRCGDKDVPKTSATQINVTTSVISKGLLSSEAKDISLGTKLLKKFFIPSFHYFYVYFNSCVMHYFKIRAFVLPGRKQFLYA